MISKASCIGLLAALVSLGVKAEAPPPTRANDLAYGEVLFSFYQQDYFKSLTDLAIAEVRGGIRGHGAHPEVLKGGMMLSYGMIGPAERIFNQLLAIPAEGQPEDQESVGLVDKDHSADEEGLDVENGLALDNVLAQESGLDQESKKESSESAPDEVYVSPVVRMQAWFYLSKVHYLRRNWEKAQSSLAQVDFELLEDEWPERLEEYYYLKAQTMIGLKQLDALDDLLAEMRDEVDESSLSLSYLTFNKSLALLDRAEIDEALLVLQEISFEDYEELLEDSVDEDEESLRSEILALQDRVALTKATLYLEKGEADQAMKAYRQIRLNGPWSERALFGFALAAANNKRFGLALGALEQLNSMQSDSPWVRESHYAIAYIYEQLEQEGRALKAYRNAVDAYNQSSASLLDEIRSLDENYFAGKMALPGTGRKVAIDDPELSTDSYGRLKVQPAAANLATLFASEAFLTILKDIRELTFLKNDLETWKSSVGSFEVMVETRKQAREQRVKETAESLAEKQSQEIQERRDRLAGILEQGLQDESGQAFLNEEQLEFKGLIEEIKDRLKKLENDPDIEEYREKLRRIEGHFIWQVSETSSAQSWDARKALKELDETLGEYNERRSRLSQLMSDQTVIATLEQRVDAAKPRIEQLSQRVSRALKTRKEEAAEMARKELRGQQERILTYLNASKLARARIADKLLEESLGPISGSGAPAGQVSSPDDKEPEVDTQSGEVGVDDESQQAPSTASEEEGVST
ncbi:hypothetical protein [Hahella ganghwensis]|uniref:hypothetical protein n=1 Tax=Hahella ganghwensis TaxID=286420 RepID=UPI0003A42DAE|nr:hypothetical protein [Hahella ganghwensis]